jgi:hypothetical protein
MGGNGRLGRGIDGKTQGGRKTLGPQQP